MNNPSALAFFPLIFAWIYTFAPTFKEVTPAYKNRRNIFLCLGGIVFALTNLFVPIAVAPYAQAICIAAGLLTACLGAAYFFVNRIAQKNRAPSL